MNTLLVAVVCIAVGWILGEIWRSLTTARRCTHCDGYGHEGGCEVCGKVSKRGRGL